MKKPSLRRAIDDGNIYELDKLIRFVIVDSHLKFVTTTYNGRGLYLRRDVDINLLKKKRVLNRFLKRDLDEKDIEEILKGVTYYGKQQI